MNPGELIAIAEHLIENATYLINNWDNGAEYWSECPLHQKFAAKMREAVCESLKQRV
jgi:hypothetical protein